MTVADGTTLHSSWRSPRKDMMFPPIHNSIQFIDYSKVNNIFDHVELGTRFPAVFLTLRTCRGSNEKDRIGDKEDRRFLGDEEDRHFLGNEEGRPSAFLGDEKD